MVSCSIMLLTAAQSHTRKKHALGGAHENDKKPHINCPTEDLTV